MSEFDFIKDWTIILPGRSYDLDKELRERKVIKLYGKTRPEVMRHLSAKGLVSYKIESE